MLDLLQLATREMASYLGRALPQISDEWWSENVIQKLTFPQQDYVKRDNATKLEQLDLAALLRVIDLNWAELYKLEEFPREGRSWVKELQTVRNRWAHLSAERTPAREQYRDVDTLYRFLTKVIRASDEAIEEVEAKMANLLSEMSSGKIASPVDVPEENQVDTPESPVSAADSWTVSNKPLFEPGDYVSLKTDPGNVLSISKVIPGGAECRYVVLIGQRKQTCYESQLETAQINQEERILSAEQLQAYLTSLEILSPSTAHLFSLRSGRIQFVPYQYRPVLKFIRADRPRLLIADEVGVGKTIEAGLIIKELRARMNLESILIICPKALVSEKKWYLEMKRFDESFAALDGKSLRHCLKETHLGGEWPDRYANVILPTSLFNSDLVYGGKRHQGGGKSHPGLVQMDPPPQFDLIIVDEAHHLRNADTKLHQGVRHLCDHAKAVVFLSATPVQLGSDDLFALLNMLRPDLVIDKASFEQMAEPNPYINKAIKECRTAKANWQNEARDQLERVAGTAWGKRFLRESKTFQETYDQLSEDHISDECRIELIQHLEELYTFSGLINRTRRRDIGEFTVRKSETREVPFTKPQQALHDSLLAVVEGCFEQLHGQQNVKFMMSTLRRQAASCLYGLAPFLRDLLESKLDRLELLEAGYETQADEDDVSWQFNAPIKNEIEAVIEQAESLDNLDPKVNAFVELLEEKGLLSNNKALVFSTFRHTLTYLTEHVRKTELRCGLIHGGVPDEERAKLRRRFALPKKDPEAIDVLLSSEVGCEGLDFQFCDFLINYDLPWNPMKIEQRIGRIDRYGQKSESVLITNFITPGTVDAEIYDRCLRRIGVFEHAIGGSEEILGKVTKDIRDIAESFDLSPTERKKKLQQLSENSIRLIKEETKLENGQAELFGLNVPKQSWRREIEAAESYWLSPEALESCVTTYLDAKTGKPGKHRFGQHSVKTLILAQEARDSLLVDYRGLPRTSEPTAFAWKKWLQGSIPNLSVTFDQKAAREDPEVVHLSVLHPLVRQAALYLQDDEPAFTALEVESDSVPQGDYLFALYQWKKVGLKKDELLIPVCSSPVMDDKLLLLLQSAKEVTQALPYDKLDELDQRHYEKWSAARANHVAETKGQVEQRIQSLAVSNNAQCKAIKDHLETATEERILRMREGQLSKAEADFDRSMSELQQAAKSGDIRFTPLVSGMLVVTAVKNGH